ncbi:MAG: hypothetical protein KKA07_08815 [Bacteroidetes bacterium]|nr:hypothetical protein [Bacteroidota bacterium]MBU1719163.1 hypothetical protein [Bacteroidota bacterium]
MENITGTILTLCGAAFSVVYALVYLFRPKFMGYHSKATGKKWEEIDKGMQTLVLALMRAAGGGLLSAGITMAFLQFQFNAHRQDWIALAILISGGAMILGSLFAVLMVRFKTPGRPPIPVIIAALLLIVAGYFFNCQ